MTTQPRNGDADLGDSQWELPPLILHPFADRASSERLLETSRTVLMAGLAPADASGEDLGRRLLEGRFSEIRMLFFLGRDLVRWIEQCMDWSGRIPELSAKALREQSFARLLTCHMPDAVTQKLAGWGVQEAGVIFARAIALNRLFAEPPEFAQLADSFIRHYHRYADDVFECWQQMVTFREITSANFRFNLYASGEYTKMLESEWGTESESSG
jgi:hypothetical protein